MMVRLPYGPLPAHRYCGAAPGVCTAAICAAVTSGGWSLMRHLVSPAAPLCSASSAGPYRSTFPGQ